MVSISDSENVCELSINFKTYEKRPNSRCCFRKVEKVCSFQTYLITCTFEIMLFVITVVAENKFVTNAVSI